MAKAKKKRKLKLKALFLLIFIFALVGVIDYYVFGFETKNIFIYGNNTVSDQEIIKLANLEDYPNYYTVTNNGIERRIKANKFVKDVDVKKKFFRQIHINVEEYKILFYYSETSSYVLENAKEIKEDNDIINIPILINYVPNTKYQTLVKKMKDIDEDIITKISEIKYDPNEFDTDRFLLYMNDSNYVYVTLTKLDVLNKYNEAVTKLEGKKGILYLDSGNYFKIIE